MELWTDYEGRTIDGAYPLTKLIEPEGRSAFFSTSNGTGIPTVIRLIESHFDDEEILARWRGVAALDHPNLVTLKKFGSVTLDETPLVYAVMEPVEANLGQIVRERRLTVLETRQVAFSLLAALEALHAHGFVHEHVEPANVLAVGEAIKLRSDCIREASEEEGRRQKAQDVHDYGVVLLQCLTQQRTLEHAARELPLTAPFDEIVRKSLSGEWGLAQISKALGPAPAVAPAATPPAAATRSAGAAQDTVGAARTPAAAVAAETTADSGSEVSRAAAMDRGAIRGAAAATPAAAAVSSAAPILPAGASKGGTGAGAASSAGVEAASAGSFSSMRRRVAVEEERGGQGKGLALRAAAVLLIAAVLFLAWHFLHGRPTEQGTAAPPVATPAPIIESGAVAGAAANSAARSGPAATADGDRAQPATSSSAEQTTGQWRVVAFTYNREEQAKEKAASLGKAHPDLQFGVFTPTGHAPYLVTIGGQMSRQQAFALSGKAKRKGLPRDVYAQNYRGRR